MKTLASQVGLKNVDNTADNVKNVLSATKLTTARTINIIGDITATAVSFNGTTNIEISASVNDNSHAHTVANITGLQGVLDGITSAWVDITGKPSTFPPDSHGHIISDVTGLQTALDGKASTHTHPYLLSTGGTVTGIVSTAAIRTDSSDNYSFIARASAGNNAALYVNKSGGNGIGRIATFGTSVTAGDAIVSAIEEDGSYNAMAGGLKTGSWEITENADGSLGFFL